MEEGQASVSSKAGDSVATEDGQCNRILSASVLSVENPKSRKSLPAGGPARLEGKLVPGVSRTEMLVVVREALAPNICTAGGATGVVEAQVSGTWRAGALSEVGDAEASSAGKLTSVDETQALLPSNIREPATLEDDKPSTSKQSLQDGVPQVLSSSNPDHPPRKRKMSNQSQQKDGGKTPVAGKSAVKKKRARKAPRQPAPRYFVHETGNDMLLIISNDDQGYSDISPRKFSKWKKKTKVKRKTQKGSKKVASQKRRKPAGGTVAGQPHSPMPGTFNHSEPTNSLLKVPDDGRWGDQLPVEILVRIFSFLVGSDGAVPCLCRVSRVCRLWQGAAANPVLWKNVSISFCWMTPQKKLQLVNQKKMLTTMQWLATNRFPLLREFSLHHWKSQVPSVLKTLADSCPHLTSLKLSHCSGIDTDGLLAVASQCSKLESLNLQNSQVEAAAVPCFLEASGQNIRHLWLTYGTRLSSVFTKLSSGCCSELQFLEVTTEIKQGTDYLEFSIEALQAGCPNLQVLHLLNVIWSPKSRGRCQPGAMGFPELVELSLATSSFSFVGDEECLRILQASTKLRVLDLRGCYRVTPTCLKKLPCTDLENLYLGLYCSYNNVSLPKEGSHLITWKWPHSLRELDLMGQGFCEEDLERALSTLARDGSNRVLRSLNLASTKVTLKSVLDVINSCPCLTYLNLTSCRCLPRGMKRVYSGQKDIQQCLQLLGRHPEDATDLSETV